jgi:hypothetical protein
VKVSDSEEQDELPLTPLQRGDRRLIMPIASPREPVYYYEVSNREFRLVYFMPPEMLQNLIEEDRISPRILEDFPDGVDLVCTEPDFDRFHQLYGYRPALAGDALRRAFFAILSSTRDWENFRGSGMIPAKDLERHVITVEDTLQREPAASEEIQRSPDQRTLEGRQQQLSPENIQRSPSFSLLEQMQVEGVDPGRSLRDQTFSPIEREEGEPAGEVFSKLQLKRKGG